ncbi:MAG: DUF2891 domain-containing protein [Akkermansiaceae bacterium]|nr:DUF2891 domain-containing protein [Akkermansiaceae bacterium]MCF7733756.1 DUF2891 domain-containing protein [Akkermansiaceae bacterium]
MNLSSIGCLLTLLAVTATSGGEPVKLNESKAAGFVKMALAGIDREYPNKPGEVLRGPEDLQSPGEAHPVFYGHFDWHSSVHGHWMLVRLLRLQPAAPWAAQVRRTLNQRFTREALEKEAAYFRIKENRSFERMYGWAWALRLARELRTWDDPDAKRWAAAFQPLERELVALTRDYLPKLDWPVRCGFHPETAFALAQIIDWARAAGDHEMENLVLAKARKFYANDRDYPTRYEPSGNDFFSPCLNVADLMRRVLPPAEFRQWLTAYLPALKDGKAGNLLAPVTVSDPSDGHLIHLAGLNLTRSWTMLGVASALTPEDPRRTVLQQAAEAHAKAGLALVASGHYEGEHWLASFAVYLLSGTGVE